MTYTEQQLSRFEGLARPKWKRAPLPKDIFDREISSTAFSVVGDNTAVKISPIDINDDVAFILNTLDEQHDNHLGPAFTSYASAKFRNGFHISSTKNSDRLKPIRINYNLSNDTVMAEQNLIHAKSGHSMSVVFRYETEGATSTRHHGLTRVIAEAGSTLDIIRFQNLNTASEFFDNIHFQVEEGAHVRFFDYQVGSRFKAIGCQSDLKGRHSRFEVFNGYLGFDDDLLDLSYMARHFGAHSESRILGKGALGGQARKTFRGTLDFKSGSKTSVGQEEEFVLLLSKDVNSDSIPALMCEEDDVIGEHAASIGRMDTELLFYMMSRGFSEDEARRTLVKAAVADTLESLEINTVKEDILEAFESRLNQNESSLSPIRS